MDPEHRDTSETLLIGPDFDAPPRLARCDDDDEAARAEGRRLLVRLVIAFVMIIAIGVLCFVVLPRAGVVLPFWVPLGAFVAIAVAVLVNANAEGQLPTRRDADGCGAEGGRAVGCCPGPRPPRFLSQPPRDR